MPPQDPFDSPLDTLTKAPPETLTVGQLNRMARRLLESHFDFVWIEGELSNLATPGSGHWYFSLKDDSAQVRCAMFRNRNTRVRFRPANGQQVRLRARVSLYEGRGEFQLIVEHMEEAGAGALQRAFEALKAKLLAEGLFAAERKRPLPEFPERIAVISSRSGAAVRDIITVFRRRFPGMYLGLFPVTVQGNSAAPEICRALADIATRADFDAIIIARGGGSAEDLWAFNDETLARAIAASPIPVVSAVGHEVDFTIADFVADQRAATPSAAAEMLSPDRRELAAALLSAERDLARVFRRHLQARRLEVGALRRQLRHPGERLREQSQRIDDAEIRLRRAMRTRLTGFQYSLGSQQSRLKHCAPSRTLQVHRQRLAQLGEHSLAVLQQRLERATHAVAVADARLRSLSPLRVLDRGYALVTDAAGELVTDPTALAVGQRISTRFSQGSLESDVVAVHEKEPSATDKEPSATHKEPSAANKAPSARTTPGPEDSGSKKKALGPGGAER